MSRSSYVRVFPSSTSGRTVTLTSDPPRPSAPIEEIFDAPRLRRLFVRDLRVDADIGVYPHEHGHKQPLLIQLELGVRDHAPAHDQLDEVVCYAAVAERVRAVIDAERVNLVETLAERVASVCLADPRVRLAKIRIEKLTALPGAGAVGVEIERRNRLP